MRSWGAYVAGEIESLDGNTGPAEQHYRSAIDEARRAGATFLVGVATVGLLTVLADAGRIQDALRGYRDVVGYFARTGNWTHLWATLRNLADLLRTLGDERHGGGPRRRGRPRPGRPGRQRFPGRANWPGRAAPRPAGSPRDGPPRHRGEPHPGVTSTRTDSTKDSSPTQAV